MDKIKVLHLLYSGLGGHGSVLFSLIEADKLQQFEVGALFTGVESLRDEYLRRCIENNISYHYIEKRRGFDIQYYWKVFRFVRNSKTQYIFLHGSSSILPVFCSTIFCKNKKKIIIRETQANHLKSKMDWVWLYFALLSAYRIVFLSKEYKEQIMRKFRGLYRSKKVVVIPNGIDLKLYKPNELALKKRLHIGMQSRLVKIKDHISLINAFALLRLSRQDLDCILYIAGEGENKAVLVEQVFNLTLEKSVKFLGILEECQMVTFINDLDIYVHASFGETMSTSIMQAMACGKPIIASDVPGINNMIQHETTGLLVPVNNAEAIKGAIIRLVDNRSLARELGVNATLYAKNHYSNITMLELYKILVFN